MNLNTTISLSLVVGKAKNKIKNCHLGAGMSVIGDISDLLSRGSKVVGLNFDEEEEEEKYTTNCVPHLLSIPVEKYDKFCFLSFLSLHREMKTYPCLMVGWACRQTTLSATDPSITHTHTPDQPNFCLQYVMGCGFPCAKWEELWRPFCWLSSMFQNFHPLILLEKTQCHMLCISVISQELDDKKQEG